MADNGRANRSTETEVVLGRIAALQPRISRDDLDEAVMGTEDPLVLNNIANVVRLWGYGRTDLPEDFAEELKVTAVSRQPLAMVVAATQHVSRMVVEFDEPYAGGAVDAKPWPTDDLFELLPVEPTVFPAFRARDETFVPGREEVSRCTACLGAGEVLCSECGGAGTRLCPDCSGARQLMCPRCGGAGSHMGVSGRVVQCQVCGTRGTVPCRACERGHVGCTVCGRRGRLQCASCAGHGNQRRRFLIVTETSTDRTLRHAAREPWAVPVEKLVDEADVVEEIQWPWPATNPPGRPLDSVIPPQLLPLAVELCQAAVREAGDLHPARERITGIRLRVLATYLYRVEFACGDHSGRVFVGGNRCRIFCETAPTVPAGMLRTVGRLAKRAMHALQTDERPGLDPTYVEAVRGGRAHIADARCLIPDAARHAAATSVEVTDAGYRLSFDYQGDRLQLDLELDVDERGAILRAMHVLGPAHRDRFPAALAATAELSFGRLAVVKGAEGAESFAAVDLRRYDSASAEQLGWIYRTMIEEAQDVCRGRGILE